MKQNIGRIISYTAILAIICVCSFMIAKFIVRSSINGDKIPIDTSTKIN